MERRVAIFWAVALLCVACGSAIDPGSSRHNKALDENDGTRPPYVHVRLAESDDIDNFATGRRGGMGASVNFQQQTAGSNRAGNDEEDEDEDALGDSKSGSVVPKKKAKKVLNLNQFGGDSCDPKTKSKSLSKPAPANEWIQLGNTFRCPAQPTLLQRIYTKANDRNNVFACFCGATCSGRIFDQRHKSTETSAAKQKRLTEYCDPGPKYRTQKDGTKRLVSGAVGGRKANRCKVANMGECFQPCLHLVYWRSVKNAARGVRAKKTKVQQLAYKYVKQKGHKNRLRVPAPESWSFKAVQALGHDNKGFIRAIGCEDFMYTHHKFKGFPNKTKAVFWPLFNSGCSKNEFEKGKCKKYLKWAKKKAKGEKMTTKKKKKSAKMVKKALKATSSATRAQTVVPKA